MSEHITPHQMVTTDTEIKAAIAQAHAREEERIRAISARYRRADDKVIITLPSHVEIAFPRARLQGLESATPEQVAKVELEGAGSGLHWPSLDVDHYIPGLLAGIFGTTRWMRELGGRGGQAQSRAKIQAARANGRKGGRPSHTTSPYIAASGLDLTVTSAPKGKVAVASQRAPRRKVARAARRRK